MPEVGLSTDVIVGFPGETDGQFESTLSLIEETRFDVVHVAAYSPRPGTLAARMEDSVPREEKRRRRHMVESLQKRIAGEINAALVGWEVEVLVEGEKGGRWWGRTRNGKLVFFEDPAPLLGELVTVRIEKASPWALQGARSGASHDAG